MSIKQQGNEKDIQRTDVPKTNTSFIAFFPLKTIKVCQVCRKTDNLLIMCVLFAAHFGKKCAVSVPQVCRCFNRIEK